MLGFFNFTREFFVGFFEVLVVIVYSLFLLLVVVGVDISGLGFCFFRYKKLNRVEINISE